MNTKPKGFTLLEMIIVIAILASLVMFMFTSYTAVQRSARDSRRRADLEQIRAAFEQWRSDNSSYPTTLTVDCSSTGGLTNVVGLITNIYLQSIPKDPRCPARSYKAVISASDYTLGAGLESVTTICGGLGNQCGGGSINCTYCVGPYGQK